MPFKSYSMDDAGRSWKKAMHWSEIAVMDPNDPMSFNNAMAIQNFAAVEVELLTTAIRALNDIGARVDRIEQLLQFPPRRP